MMIIVNLTNNNHVKIYEKPNQGKTATAVIDYISEYIQFYVAITSIAFYFTIIAVHSKLLADTNNYKL